MVGTHRERTWISVGDLAIEAHGRQMNLNAQFLGSDAIKNMLDSLSGEHD